MGVVFNGGMGLPGTTDRVWKWFAAAGKESVKIPGAPGFFACSASIEAFFSADCPLKGISRNVAEIEERAGKRESLPHALLDLCDVA